MPKKKIKTKKRKILVLFYESITYNNYMFLRNKLNIMSFIDKKNINSYLQIINPIIDRINNL